jgi:hypothetical protein
MRRARRDAPAVIAQDRPPQKRAAIQTPMSELPPAKCKVWRGKPKMVLSFPGDKMG